MAWNAVLGPGAWRHEWIEDTDNGKPINRRRVQGLVMSEALSRCVVDDAGEGEALIELFSAIEAGALTGVHDGPIPKDVEGGDG